MSLRAEITAIIDRIETGSRIEGDPDCVFYAGHWHGTPVAEGTVCVVRTDDTIENVPTEEFYKEGRILWDIDENGRVAPPGTLAKLAEEEAAKAAQVTEEIPAEPAPEKGEGFTEEVVPEAPAAVVEQPAPAPEVKTEEQAQPVAQDAPATSTEAPAVVSEEAPVAEPVAEPTPEPSPVEPAPEPVTEAPAEVAPEVTEAPAEPAVEVPAEAPASEEPAPTPKRTKRTSL